MAHAGVASPSASSPIRWARRTRPEIVRRLASLIRIPSVSADMTRRAASERCAAELAGALRWAGLPQVSVVPTGGAPLVIGRSSSGPVSGALLVYGHYDVVPADGGEGWSSPPFQPEVRGPYLYGRGACDNKGPLMCHIAAIAAWTRAGGGLPLPIVCVCDGEEEIGSPHLEATLLASDLRGVALAVISDTRMLGVGRPTIVVGLRGCLAAEVEIRTLPRDVHSGMFGDTVPNAVSVACQAVASLHDRDGRVAIPGFYARVRSPDRRIREAVRRLDPGGVQMSRLVGARLVGELGWSPLERTVLRPSLGASGIHGGYVGPGSKSIVPARASFKLTARLVPDQDPAEIATLLARHLRRTCSSGAVRVSTSKAVPPAVVDARHPGVNAARRAARASFGRDPVLVRSGGTIPVVGILRRAVGIDSVLLGFSLPDDGMHGPNERLHLPTFEQGVATCIRLLEELAVERRRSRTLVA